MTALGTSADRLLALMPHPVLTPIVGDPTSPSITLMTDELCANASAIDCSLADGTIGYVGLVLPPATVATFCSTTFVALPKPAAKCPDDGDKATQYVLAASCRAWEESIVLFNEYRTVHGILRR